MRTFQGGCHCGAIALAYESAIAPDAAEIRACQCGFCRKHASRATSDPNGRVVIVLRDPVVQRYKFALGTAEYVVCGRCGVYVTAVLQEGDARFAIVIVNALEEAKAFSQKALPVTYDSETEEERRLRRRTRWTPATLEERFAPPGAAAG